MLIAASQNKKTGRKLLVIGLHRENVERLLNDMPIFKPLDQVEGLAGWDITILGPEDMARFVARFEPEQLDQAT